MANHTHARRAKRSRTAAAATEFAVVAPVLALMYLGTCEIGQATAGATKVASAIREGGRLASMDFSGKLLDGQTANAKIERDILVFLEATGVKTEGVTVSIEHAKGEQAGTEFDLASEANYLQLFRITVTVPYRNVSADPVNLMAGQRIVASTVFRRGRTPVNYDLD
ncbi:MAG: pilus assembly protein [bacterium]|nr:pilus assembly protein [bacterium]